MSDTKNILSDRMILIYGKTNKTGFSMERREICWYIFKSLDKNDLTRETRNILILRDFSREPGRVRTFDKRLKSPLVDELS